MPRRARMYISGEKAEKYCQPSGDDRFKKDIEDQYDFKLGQMSRGRPKKKVE